MSARQKSLIKKLALLNYSRKLLKNLTSFPKKYTTKRKSLRTRMNGKIKNKLRRNVLRSRETNAKTCQEKSALKLKGMNAKMYQNKEETEKECIKVERDECKNVPRKEC